MDVLAVVGMLTIIDVLTVSNVLRVAGLLTVVTGLASVDGTMMARVDVTSDIVAMTGVEVTVEVDCGTEMGDTGARPTAVKANGA